MEKAQQGALLGMVLSGPFGAYGGAGGQFLGFLYGMVTADSHAAQQHAKAQVQSEQFQKQVENELAKDKQLETAIEQELGRQRALEYQVAGAADTHQSAVTAPVSTSPNSVGTATQSATPPNTSQDTVVVASISSKPAPTPKPFKNVEVKDTNGDGVPDLWVYYDPKNPGEIMRQEESTRGDGHVDTWSYFKNGKLTRRDFDSKGQGRPDTIYYYSGDQIVREDRDEHGNGQITYRASYDTGRLAKVERDTTGQGRTNLWRYYDPAQEGELLLKEEQDLNGDGSPDLWSYFENGRLVRRDVNAIGLEAVSKQDALGDQQANSSADPIPGG